ncbi:hypothetical protein JCM19055_2183 [Geomicrobium sp. JCM 19055]|nr:hypothetical protein JCM19055_2183 [Geomicrobium sp. JCM 19055]
MVKKIAVLPGDGIGPEVTEAAVHILKAVAKKIRINSLNSITETLEGSPLMKKETPSPLQLRNYVNRVMRYY